MEMLKKARQPTALKVLYVLIFVFVFAETIVGYLNLLESRKRNEEGRKQTEAIKQALDQILKEKERDSK